jgi:hypothetical protein
MFAYESSLGLAGWLCKDHKIHAMFVQISMPTPDNIDCSDQYMLLLPHALINKFEIRSGLQNVACFMDDHCVSIILIQRWNLQDVAKANVQLGQLGVTSTWYVSSTKQKNMVNTRVELATLALLAPRSNQLS